MKDVEYYFSRVPEELFIKGASVWEALSTLSHFLEKKFLGHIGTSLLEGVVLENPEKILIEEGVLIEPGCFIKGPVWIRKGAVIRHGAYIRGPVFLDEGSLVGHATEVKNSIFLKKAHAAHFNYVGDSILGEGCNIGSGVKCANFRLDQGLIRVAVDGKKIETGLRKLGVILGDRSQIGCNSVTSPGTLIGKDCSFFPCMHIQGSFVSGSHKKLKQQVEDR